jgi:hypothetical protein
LAKELDSHFTKEASNPKKSPTVLAVREVHLEASDEVVTHPPEE